LHEQLTQHLRSS